MYRFYLSKHFLNQLKSLIKKYRHLKNDLILALKSFDKKSAISLGHNIYKIRVKSSDVKKGKSKSFRLIIFIWETKNTLAPVTIYFKSDKENISKKELIYHINILLNEIKKLTS